MTPSLPRLRSDLIVRVQRTTQGTSAVIKDPISGKFFRLGEAEQFIVRQLDGETSMEVIRQRAEATFSAVLPMESLSAFIQNLKKNGVLENSGAKQKSAYRAPPRFRGSPLYCRFKVFDPFQLLRRLVPWTGFFYTSFFVLLSAAVILAAAGVTFTSWDDFRLDLPRLYRSWPSIAAALALNFLVVGAHEFAHGLTCARFGGEVHEMGCALVFLQPAFYCNVSDAWLFSEKSKRLWVGFAGPYFELFLWALAVLTWRLTEPDTWINFVALSVMATSGLKTLLNFNPLIKLDGYYLLSDYLEIPNMRRRSFRYVGSRVEKLFGLESREEEVDLSRREKTIFSIYGTLALAGSFSILGFILLSAGGSLLEGRTPTAVLVTLGMLALKYRRRFRRMFGTASGASGSFDDEDFDTPQQAEDLEEPAAPKESGQFAMSGGAATALDSAPPKDAAGAEKSPAPNSGPAIAPETGDNHSAAPDKPDDSKKKKRRRWGRTVRRTIWLALAASAAVALVRGHAELRVAGPFNVLPIDNSDVRAAVDGVVDKIYVHEGDYIRQGQPVARLIDIDTRAALEKTEAQLAEADAKLRMQVAGPTANEIEVARANATKAEDSLKYAQIRLAMAKKVFDENLLSRKEYEDVAALESAARNDLAVASDQLKLLVSGTRPEDIEATRAQIEQFKADQRHLGEQRRMLTVYSPSTGVVATPTLQLKQLTHQQVKKGDLIAKVFDLRTVTAQIAVDEKDIADVRVAQKVVLRARAYPDDMFYGTVNFVSTSVLGNAASSTGGGEPAPVSLTPPSSSNTKKTILVTTQIDNHSLLLKPEMTGQAKILCGERRALDLVTRRFAHSVKVEFWSWW